MELSVAIKEAGYTDRSPVLKDIKFTVHHGELVGLIGPNGAGKSTTIKAMLGIMNHMEGEIETGNYAYIPERPIFYDKLTLGEHIDFLQANLEIDEVSFQKQAKELTDYFQLTEVLHHYPDSYSKGMQQKAMLILAFLKQPDFYIIDEPFMGLDPKATKKLLNLIHQEKARGAGLLMSTHVLDTAEKHCDRFVLIFEGRCLVEGTLEEIQKQSGLPNGSLFDCFDVLTERG